MVLVKEEEALEEVKKVGVVEVLKGVGYRPVVEGDTVEAERINGQVIEAEDGKKEDQAP
jgi:hypothetical protein